MYFNKKIGTLFLLITVITGSLFLRPTTDVVYAASPIATIVVADASLTIGETSLVTITFSEAVSGFDNADLTVENGTLSSVSSSDGGVTWTATFTPTAGITDASNVIVLDNMGFTNAAGNTGMGTTVSNNYAIDTVRPTATVVVADTMLALGETSTVTITFSEAVSGFDNADLTVANSTLSGLSSADGGITWTATLTPAAGITDASNVITLNNTGVADLAGNAGVGTTASNNYAIDTVRPTATVVVADTMLALGETSTVTITFSEAVTGFTSADLTVANGTLSSVSSSDGGITWTATFTPTAGITDASNVIVLDNMGFTNAAGNTGMGTTVSNNYAIDTVLPTATVVVADTMLALGETSTVTITFSEAVTGFTSADLTVANGTLSSVSSSDGGITWTATFTPTAGITDASNVITLNNAGVADLAGNAGVGTTNSNNYAINTIGSTATIVVADASLAIGETSLVTITFSSAVSGFDNADLTVVNGTLSSVSSSDGGVTWTATLTPTAGITDASNVIVLDNMGFTNAAGNTGMGTTVSNNYAIDTVRPTATVVVADMELALGETSTVTIIFSEAVTGFTNADLTVANGTLSGVSSSDGGITWTATLTPNHNVNAEANLIMLNKDGVADIAGNTGRGTTESNPFSVFTVPVSADLGSLTLSNGTLSPIFTSETVAYTSYVPYSVSVLNVTANVSDSRATMTVNGIPVISGQPSSNMLLNVGMNTITIIVTASDQSTKTYTISVTRENGSNGSGSSNGGGTSASGGSTTPPSPMGNTVTATHGQITLPIGTPGLVSLGKEIIISIPADASPQELKLSIENVRNPELLLTNKEILASPVFEVLKNFSENFRKPVKLTLTFDSASLKSGQAVAVFYFDEVKKVWLKVEDGVIKENQITVEVNHFTKYAVLVVDKTTGMSLIDNPKDLAPATTFSDISGHWAEASIKQAISDGILTGYPDGTFKPGNAVTRAGFSVMLMNALKSQEAGTKLTFTDTTEIGNWAKRAVEQAVQAGIINGYEDGTFRPNANMTRAEMATMIANALKLATEGSARTPFADDKAIPAWAKGSVAALKELGIVKGMGSNAFNPGAQTTRAEAVIVLMNF